MNETFVYGNIEMKNSKDKKILGVIIDNKRRLKSHVKNLCKKASQKIWALSSLINCLNDSKEKMIYVSPSRKMQVQLDYSGILLLFDMDLSVSTHFINLNVFILLGFFCCRCKLVF